MKNDNNLIQYSLFLIVFLLVSCNSGESSGSSPTQNETYSNGQQIPGYCTVDNREYPSIAGCDFNVGTAYVQLISRPGFAQNVSYFLAGGGGGGGFYGYLGNGIHSMAVITFHPGTWGYSPLLNYSFNQTPFENAIVSLGAGGNVPNNYEATSYKDDGIIFTGTAGSYGSATTVTNAVIKSQYYAAIGGDGGSTGISDGSSGAYLSPRNIAPPSNGLEMLQYKNSPTALPYEVLPTGDAHPATYTKDPINGGPVPQPPGIGAPGFGYLLFTKGTVLDSQFILDNYDKNHMTVKLSLSSGPINIIQTEIYPFNRTISLYASVDKGSTVCKVISYIGDSLTLSCNAPNYRYTGYCPAYILDWAKLSLRQFTINVHQGVNANACLFKIIPEQLQPPYCNRHRPPPPVTGVNLVCPTS